MFSKNRHGAYQHCAMKKVSSVKKLLAMKHSICNQASVSILTCFMSTFVVVDDTF